MKFKEIFYESIINLFTKEEKSQYVDEIWDLLQESYKSIGGIKGSGFQSKNDMIDKIKLWKVVKKNNKILAGLLYKDRHDLRKTVGVFTDGSKEGKRELEKLLKDDLDRSLIEVSHSLMKFMERKMPSLVKKYVKTTDEAREILQKEIKPIDDTHYERDINGTKIIKMMLGTGKKFKNS